jgi:hypothetical protein
MLHDSWWSVPLAAWLEPVEIWRLRFATGEVASATLSPTAECVAVVWYLDDQLQDAAQFQNREGAVRWADDIRHMLSATSRA